MMKKMIKKSVAALIAVLMVISTMPFTAITASAATNTLSNSGFTIVYNSNNNSNTRWENGQFNIVNDQESSNTSVGILKYDISVLKGKTIDSANLNFSVDSWDGDGKGVVFYYSNGISNVTLNNGATGDSNLSYGSGTTANTGAASRYGFDVNNTLTTVTRGDTASKSVDIANAVKSVLSSGSNEFYVFIMQQTAGGSAAGKLDSTCTSGWTDTKIKPTNVTITYSTSVKTDYTFDEMVTKLNNFTPYSPNAHGSFSNDTTYTNYSDHYKGLVYAEDVRDYSATGSVGLSSGVISSNTNYANLYFPTSVALYTGSNEITVPIMISTATARSGTYDCLFRPHAGVISGTGLSLVNNTWNGKTEVDGGSDNCYANGNQTSNLPGLDFMKTINLTSYYLSTTVATSPTNSNIDPGYGRKAQIFANKVKVSPSFNDNTKSTVLTYNPTITYYVTPKDNSINTAKYITFNSTDAVTVVNYKPYLDKVNTAKQDIKSMNNIGSAHYEANSLKAYVDACVKLVNLDPSDYSKYAYSSATANAAQTLANDINSALTAYDNAKAGLKFNYTFIDVNNKSTVVVAKNEAEALANKPNNTLATKKTSANDQATHEWTEYTWPTTATDYKFTEIETVKTEAHNIVDGKCADCGYVALDTSSYEAAVSEANDIIANGENKYTSDSLEAYKNAVYKAMDEGNAAGTQEEVNAATSKILFAKSLLAKAQVTITFIVQNDDTDTETTEKKTVAWGDTVVLDSKSSKVSKWTVDVNGTTSVAANAESVYSHVATEDATIIAYVSNEESETVQYSKVVFYGKNNAIVGIVYVPADGTPVTTSSLFTAPEVPFYNFLGWDKADITADGSEISVKASYAPKSETEDKCGVWLNGQFVKSYSYDSYVYLFGADKSKKYAMYSDAACTELITYFDGVDFYSPHIDNLYIKEVNEADRKATVGFTGSFKNGNTSSFNVKFWLPEGATLVETGVDWNVTMEDGRVGSGHDRATKFSQRNEYTYNATFSAAKKTVKFTPYVTYTVGGNKTTVYGTPQTVEY